MNASAEEGRADGADALRDLAALLAEDDSVIADHLVDASEEPRFGVLVAAGPRASEARGEYALLVESVREGYLLHFGEPRIIDGADEDLRLLAGDYLYALALEKLAALGDLDAVGELADLISISAQLHAERSGAGAAETWLASTVAVALGADEGHERAKRAIRAAEDGAARAMRSAAEKRAQAAGLSTEFALLAESIESR